MADNLKKVIDKNSGSEGILDKKYLDKIGHRYLFNYAGKKMIWRAGASLLDMDISTFLLSIDKVLKCYSGRIAKDPILLCMLITALLKIPFRSYRYRDRSP
jgi:hypothetical protein